MSQKYFDGEITNKNINETLDEEFIESIKNLPSEVDKAMEKLEIGNAIDKIFDVLRKSNKYIDDTTPWSLAKDDTKNERLETVLYNLLESIKVCGSELMPFLPDTSKEILRQINTELSNNFETSNKYNVLTPEPIFMRIDTAKKLEEINAKRS